MAALEFSHHPWERRLLITPILYMRNLERLSKLSRMTPLRRGGAGTQVKFHWPADLCPTYGHRAGPKQVEGLGYDEW